MSCFNKIYTNKACFDPNFYADSNNSYINTDQYEYGRNYYI